MRKIAGGLAVSHYVNIDCHVCCLSSAQNLNGIGLMPFSIPKVVTFKVGHKDILFLGKNVCLPSCHNCSQKLWVFLPSLSHLPPYRVQDDLFMLSTSPSLLPLSQSLLLPAVGFAVSSVGCLLLLLLFLPLPPSLCAATPPRQQALHGLLSKFFAVSRLFLENFGMNSWSFSVTDLEGHPRFFWEGQANLLL